MMSAKDIGLVLLWDCDILTFQAYLHANYIDVVKINQKAQKYM